MPSHDLTAGVLSHSGLAPTRWGRNFAGTVSGTDRPNRSLSHPTGIERSRDREEEGAKSVVFDGEEMIEP